MRKRILTRGPRRSAAIIGLLFAMVVVPTLNSAGTNAQGAEFTFPDTGKTIRGKFLTYWASHGAQNGRAISDEMQERSDTDSKTYTVQYFERAVYELHPENQPPYDVLLSLLGRSEYNRKYRSGPAPAQAPDNDAGAYFFQETGRHLACQFLDYWLSNGGLAIFGYPITDEMTETSELTGQPVRVQYFERAVFEYHMESYFRADNPRRPYSNIYLRGLGTTRFVQEHSSQLPPSVAVPRPPNGCSPTISGPSATSPWPDPPVRSSVGKGHILRGVVRSRRDCSPLSNAKIVFWLAGPDGNYDDDHQATVFTDAKGAYTFESNYPAFYGAGGPHIHLGLSAPGYARVETEIFLYCGQTEGTLDLALTPEQ